MVTKGRAVQKILTEICNLCCDLDFEQSNPTLHPALGDPPSSCKRIISSEAIEESYFDRMSSHCDPDLEDSKPTVSLGSW